MGLISYDEGIKIALESVKHTLSVERLALDAAVGRILAEDIKATFDYPPFDYSAMDGFAVRSTDTLEATEEDPVALEIIGEIAAGQFVERELPPKRAYKIFTGAPIPPGADAVVEIEKVDVRGNHVYVCNPVEEGANIRKRGEYARLGDTVVERGEELKPGHIGVAAAFGYTMVKVYRRPKVGILSTGSEIVEPGEPLLKPGQIYNTNSHSLKAALESHGAMAVNLGNLPDDYDRLKEFMLRHMSEFDVFITTGGVSMGEKDYVQFLVKELGVDVKFHGWLVKPGKPLLFGTYDGEKRLFIGLPGNPVSVLVNFYIFVYPLLRKLQGAKRLFKPTITAVLTAPFRRKNAKRREFIRVKLEFRGDGTVLATPYGNTSSGDMLSMAFADGLAIIHEGVTEVNDGEYVPVILL
jgi:molybdopterin molybdotransferase